MGPTWDVPVLFSFSADNLTLNGPLFLQFLQVLNFLHFLALRNSIFISFKKLNEAKEYFRLCETFFRFFSHRRVPPSICWYFWREWILKNPKWSPISVFLVIVRLLFEKKNHKRVPNSPILWYFEVFLVFLSPRYGADLGRSRLVVLCWRFLCKVFTRCDWFKWKRRRSTRLVLLSKHCVRKTAEIFVKYYFKEYI